MGIYDRMVGKEDGDPPVYNRVDGTGRIVWHTSSCGWVVENKDARRLAAANAEDVTADGEGRPGVGDGVQLTWNRVRFRIVWSVVEMGRELQTYHGVPRLLISIEQAESEVSNGWVVHLAFFFRWSDDAAPFSCSIAVPFTAEVTACKDDEEAANAAFGLAGDAKEPEICGRHGWAQSHVRGRRSSRVRPPSAESRRRTSFSLLRAPHQAREKRAPPKTPF